MTMDESGMIKVFVSAAPVDGAANEAVMAVISDSLKIPASRLEIFRGHTSRLKTIRITGVTATELADKIAIKFAKGDDG